MIDSADFEAFSKVKWTLWSGYPKVGRMHRIVIGARPDGIPEDYVVDHIDRNKCNNRRANLRWVSTSFNIWNIDVKKGCSRLQAGESRRRHRGRQLHRPQELPMSFALTKTETLPSVGEEEYRSIVRDFFVHQS